MDLLITESQYIKLNETANPLYGRWHQKEPH